MFSTLHKQPFLVLSNEADIHHRASVFSMGNYLQEAGRSHAEALGWGVNLLRTKNQFWVLARLHIQLLKRPAPGQTVVVHTWPKGTDRHFALRDFLVFLDDELIARATSTWALLQLPQRRPIALDVMDERLFERKNDHAITAIPDKIESPEITGQPRLHTVVFSELDQNGHVNNTRYLNWMLDTFPTEFHRKNEVAELQANYLAEVFPDQEIAIYRQEVAENKFVLEFKGPKNKPLFRGNILFKGIP
jgi:medium-chain acyl-[acyl-carrier-protein] hydrolase